MIWRNIYETIVEHVETATWAKCPQEFRSAGGYILEKFSGSFKNGPRRWAESNQGEGKGAGNPFRRISVNKNLGVDVRYCGRQKELHLASDPFPQAHP